MNSGGTPYFAPTWSQTTMAAHDVYAPVGKAGSAGGVMPRSFAPVATRIAVSAVPYPTLVTNAWYWAIGRTPALTAALKSPRLMPFAAAVAETAASNCWTAPCCADRSLTSATSAATSGDDTPAADSAAPKATGVRVPA